MPTLPIKQPAKKTTAKSTKGTGGLKVWSMSRKFYALSDLVEATLALISGKNKVKLERFHKAVLTKKAFALSEAIKAAKDAHKIIKLATGKDKSLRVTTSKEAKKVNDEFDRFTMALEAKEKEFSEVVGALAVDMSVPSRSPVPTRE
jgi:hypothetical protein